MGLSPISVVGGWHVMHYRKMTIIRRQNRRGFVGRAPLLRIPHIVLSLMKMANDTIWPVRRWYFSWLLILLTQYSEEQSKRLLASQGECIDRESRLRRAFLRQQ